MDLERILAGVPLSLEQELELEPDARECLQRRLAGALRRAIHSGALPPGSRLPSTRACAADLGVSRNTVLYAYEQLEAEGYLVPRPGSGTYVSAAIPQQDVERAQPRPSASAPRLARRCERTAALDFAAELPAGTGPFMVGLPDLHAFPWKAWGRLTAARLRSADPALLDHGDPRGHRDLRDAIAMYLRTSRGVRCTPDQVFVVNGSQHALSLAARVLLDPDDTVWMEEPGYRGARAAFLGAGARVVGVPLDGEGMNPAAAPPGAPPRLLFVTPSNQFPTGVTLGLARRLAWIEFAREHDAWILEDDYDSEFRYTGAPVPALQGLDEEGRVLYAGTFSKTLSPALRTGYLVLPERLTQPFAALRAIADPYTSGLGQAVLADWIHQGHYARHLARMRRHYRRRRRFLQARLEADFSDVFRVREASGGLHLVADLPPGADEVRLARALREGGVKASPISAFHLGVPERPALLLGYAGFDESRTLAALARMRAVIDSVGPGVFSPD